MNIVRFAATVATLVISQATFGAVTFNTLYSFSGSSDGALPNNGFVFDKTGAFYGTSLVGGTLTSGCPIGCGTFFRIDPKTGKKTIIHPFGGTSDGTQPNGGLVADANGVIYGTTGFGGAGSGGTIFRYDPGSAAFSTIHAFGRADGANPLPLAFDNQGALYGATVDGGLKNSGTLFKFDPKTGRSTVLHAFGTSRNEGDFPNGRVTFDGQSAIYGAMAFGGAHGGGTLYKFDLSTHKFATVYGFGGSADGGDPTGSMQIGPFGLLIGMTGGNSATKGTIFAFSPGTQKLITLYSFTGGSDGAAPTGGLALDPHGNFWGETTSGGNGYGTIFRLASGHAVTLHTFGRGEAAEGATNTGLTFFNGNLYGASPYGGDNNPVCAGSSTGPFGCGTVFSIR
jgi:uncharacterized repeat protein (TIGR03803 family)